MAGDFVAGVFAISAATGLFAYGMVLSLSAYHRHRLTLAIARVTGNGTRDIYQRGVDAGHVRGFDAGYTAAMASLWEAHADHVRAAYEEGYAAGIAEALDDARHP